MSNRRVGLWLIGSFGGVVSTAALGLSALSRGLTDETSQVTALPLFHDLDLDPPSAFIVGGHEIRRGGFRQTVREFQQRANIYDRDMTAACEPDLEKWEANVKPGVALNSGQTIQRLADWPESLKADTPSPGVEQIQADLRAFKETNRLDQVVVVNVTSTEPPFETGDLPTSPEKLTVKGKTPTSSTTRNAPACGNRPSSGCAPTSSSGPSKRRATSPVTANARRRR